MRKHLNDHVFHPLAWLLTIILITLLTLVLMLVTPVGVKIIATTADSALKELSVKGVTGSLISGLHIDEIIWDDGDSISLENVNLKLQYYNLNRGRLVAKVVSAERLNINIATSSTGDTTSLPNFGLPLNMNAHLIQLDTLQITENISDDPGSRNLLFQIKNIQLKKVTISDGYLRFRRLQGAPIILDQALEINVTEGRLNMNQPHDIKTSGSVAYKHPELGDIDGEIQLAGTLVNYDFKGQVNHQQKDFGKQAVTFLGQGDYKRVHLEKLALDSPYGKVDVKGRLHWDPEIQWVFLVKGEDLTTKNILPEWPVRATSELRYSGSYVDNRLENNIKILSIEGLLRDYQLKLAGNIKEREGVLTTDDLVLQLGENEIKLSGRANEPFDLSWNIDAKNITQLLPKQLIDLKLSGQVKGSGHLKGRLNKPELNVNLIANQLVYNGFQQGKESIQLNGDIGLDGRTVLLKNLLLKSAKNSFHAKGKATEPFNLKWDINAEDLKQLSPQLAGKISGTGQFKGSIDKPEVQINLKANNLAFQDFKQGKETFFLEGGLVLDDGVIQLKKLIAKSGKNTLEASGRASEPVKLALNFNAQDLSQVSPDLAGRIQGKGEIQGLYQSPIIKVDLNASKIRYQNQQYLQSELTLKTEVQVLEGVPMIKSLVSRVGNNRVQISGRAISPFNLTWNIEGKDLKQFMPELSGQLIAKGRLQGDINQPIINATLKANKLHYQNFKLASADVSAKTNNGQYAIKGNLKGLEGQGQKINTANIDLAGRIDNHRIVVDLEHQEAKVSLKANGAWKNQHWQGAVQKLLLNKTQAGDWRLQKPIQLSISKDAITSSQLCLGNKQTSTCSTFAWSKTGGVNTKGTLNKTPLALLKPLLSDVLPEGMDFNGSISGTYDIRQNNGKPIGNIHIKLPNSHFSFKDEDGDEQTLAYEGAELTATINDRKIKANMRMQIVNRGKLTSSATITLSPENGKHTINGSAQFDVPNIHWAQSFIPHSRGLRGAFNSKVTFSGLLTKPVIIGKAQLKNAYLRLPEAGTELTNINFNIRADKAGQAVLKGKMLMGKGVIRIAGKLDIRNIVNWKASVSLRGDNILFMNTNEIRATMSPDLTVDISPKYVDIKGKVVIPSANINLKEIPELSIDESDDAFVIGERKPGEQVSAIRVRPNVIIRLGNNVKLKAFGLRAKLLGEVKVSHNRQDIITTGFLKVTDGKYQAYGQNLDIKNGRLIFNGSPKLIGMDIRATRKVDSTLVGVHLGGTLRSPKSKIYSDDAELSESEILSYLITGHSLSTASGKESALLMSAVRGLGITGSDSLIHKIGSSLGLDDVNIVTDQDIRKSKLQLGKQLGSRLYVRYLVGLFDRAQKIAVEYKINKVLSLEADATADNYGLDFIYEIDRD